MTALTSLSAAQRERATDFVGRIAQLDPAGLVRLISHPSDSQTADPAPGRHCGELHAVDLWAKAGFGVLATRRIEASLDASPITVYATNFVAGLAVSTAPDVDPGRDVSSQWHGQLAPDDGWVDVGALTASEIASAVRSGTATAKEAVEKERAHELAAATKATVPPRLLDVAMCTMPTDSGGVPVSMRMLFALSGMGFVGAAGELDIRVRVTKTWLRLDAPNGSVARRRMADLPLA